MFEILSEHGLEYCYFDPSTLDFAYIINCTHKRTSKTW